jgi:hypothetical protein
MSGDDPVECMKIDRDAGIVGRWARVPRVRDAPGPPMRRFSEIVGDG